MRVLVIEDEAKTTAYLVKGLREHGFNVEAVSDGRDGLHKAQFERFDIAILDIMLPGKDGKSVLKELRASGSQIPVVMLTACDSVAERVQGLDLGADD